MRLREVLLGVLLALGVVPAAVLALSLLPGVLEAFHVAARQTSMAHAQAEAQRLSQRLERRKETVRNIAMLPAVAEVLQIGGNGGPQLDVQQASQRLTGVMRRWFGGANDLRSLAVTDGTGRERLRLDMTATALVAAEPSAEPRHGLGAHFTQAMQGPCDDPHAELLADSLILRLFVPVKCQTDAAPVGMLVMDFRTDDLFADYQEALWVDSAGRFLRQPGSLPGAAYAHYPALRQAKARPAILSDSAGNDVAWVPLVLDAEAAAPLWLGSPVDRHHLDAWLTALKVRSGLVVAMLGIILLLAVRWLTGRLDNMKSQMLTGLHRVVAGDGGVRFAWAGPAEIVQLGEELTQLAALHTAANDARQRAEFQLSQEKVRAEGTLHSITDGVITTDRQGWVLYLNPASQRLLGVTAEEASGRPLHELFSLVDEVTREPRRLALAEVMAENRAVDAGFDALLVGPSRAETQIQVSAAPMHGVDGGTVGAVVVLRDVSQERRLQRMLSHQASHDTLTGLANRGAFEMMLTQALAEGRRHEDAGLWLCYVDLDQFKMINDACGHQAGDALLRQVAAELRLAVRDSDVLSRMGGDEFAVLLKRCNQEGAYAIVDRMRRHLAAFRFSWEGQAFSTSGSFGLVPIDRGSGSLYDLLSAADSACYIAKDRGRNRIHVADRQDEAVRRFGGEIKWAHETVRALETDRLCLYYQPIKPLRREGGLHIEILVRMHDESGALVPPGAFIPAAERYNLMRDVDRWVLNNTLKNFRDAPSGSVVAVNLSGQSLCDDDFLEFALTAIRSSGIDPTVLCFEVTETAAMSNLARAQEVIRALQDQGSSFALDDFGSGLSSFGYLKNLPVNYLKIDGSFVRNILVEPLDRAFVQSMSDLGHLMGIETIAEFVENEEIERVLREIGVDYAQGYGIAKPAPIEMLRATGWLAAE